MSELLPSLIAVAGFLFSHTSRTVFDQPQAPTILLVTAHFRSSNLHIGRLYEPPETVIPVEFAVELLGHEVKDSTNPPEGRLLKVYPSEGDEDNTSVDIIAIHGLATTTPHTWEYKTKTGPVVNWLSDSKMLPHIVPSARIYTFSWNAKYYEDASVARIDSVAEVLLSNLQSQRDKDGDNISDADDDDVLLGITENPSFESYTSSLDLVAWKQR
ncbi:MAG: hypothetical protein Q9161_007083 [Pseudevernia consocians]